MPGGEFLSKMMDSVLNSAQPDQTVKEMPIITESTPGAVSFNSYEEYEQYDQLTRELQAAGYSPTDAGNYAIDHLRNGVELPEYQVFQIEQLSEMVSPQVVENVVPEQLPECIVDVTYVTTAGEEYAGQFDTDANGHYDLIRFQLNSDGTHQAEVGKISINIGGGLDANGKVDATIACEAFTQDGQVIQPFLIPDNYSIHNIALPDNIGSIVNYQYRDSSGDLQTHDIVYGPLDQAGTDNGSYTLQLDKIFDSH